jgi:hypothetical protein
MAMSVSDGSPSEFPSLVSTMALSIRQIHGPRNRS